MAFTIFFSRKTLEVISFLPGFHFDFLFVCLFVFWNKICPYCPGWPFTADPPISASPVLGCWHGVSHSALAFLGLPCLNKDLKRCYLLMRENLSLMMQCSVPCWFLFSLNILYRSTFFSLSRNLKVMSKDKMALKWWTRQYGLKRCQTVQDGSLCHQNRFGHRSLHI